MKHPIHYVLVLKHITDIVVCFSLLKTASNLLTVQHQINIRILFEDVSGEGLYPLRLEYLTYSLNRLHLK